MKRKMLEDLKLDKEVIDKIMAENGTDIEAEKAKTVTATTERDGFKKTLDETNLELKKFDGLDLETQKQSIIDLNLKYDTDTNDLKTKLELQASNHITEKFADGYKFTSPLAKKAAVAELIKQGFKIDGTTVLGAKDFMDKMKTDSPTAFEKEEDPNAKPPANWGHNSSQQQPPATTEYNFPK